MYLLGRVCKETGRDKAAAAHFADALALDPFMWCAYEELCALGAEAEAEAATEAAARSADRYPKLAEALKLAGRGFGGAAESTSFGTGTHGGEISSAATDSEGTSGLSGGGGGGLGGAHSGASSNPNHALGGILGTVAEGTPTTTPRASSLGFAKPPSGSGLPSGAPSASGAVPMSTGGESAYHGAYGDERTPAPDSTRGLMPPAPPSTATAAGVPADDLVTPAPAGDADHGKPPGPPGGPGGGGGGRGGGGRRKFVDEGKLRKVSGQLFQESAGAGSGAVRRSSRLAAQTGGAGGGLDFSTPAMEAGSAAAAAAAVAEDVDPTTSPPHHRARGRGVRSTHNPRGSLDGGSRHADQSRPPLPLPPTSSSGHGASGMNAGNGSNGYPHAGHAGYVGCGRFAEGAAATAALLRPLADGLRTFSMFRCDDALAHLRELPRSQYVTGYVLCLVGRAYAEMVNYPEAQRAFEWARTVCPHGLDGMEVYSTVLWHLKKEVELSYLAQECVQLDRLAPQTWCVLGNCFSLQKEHETALRFFQRALQLDPRCTYAHTLCGHEFFANEDFEKAMGCYRNALRLDGRHYNAWYGLGTVYYRQEKYELSEYHFRHALSINSRSSVLFCYLGMAQHALRRNADALTLLQHAIDLDKRNPLAKYEKASVLLSEDRLEDALEELERLKEVAPREASVFFLIGRIHKKLGAADAAMVAFSTALDLKPASADVNLIKSAIEKLHVPDDSEEEDL